MRLMGMMRSLEDLAKSLCAAGSHTAAESAAVAYAFSEIQREISYTDVPTKAAASRCLSAITRQLLASPAAADSAPDDLFLQLAEDLVPHLASANPHAIAVTEAARVLAASPSAFPVLFKPLTSCLVSCDPGVSTAAVAALLSAEPADAAPFLPLAPILYNLLSSSCSINVLINILRVLARLFPLDSRLCLVVDPVCQLLDRFSDMFLTFQCIRTVLAARPAHGVSLAIRKVKEFLPGARDPNLGLLALGMLYLGYANECRDVIALLLDDADSNICRDALHLLMEMVDGYNIMGIAGMLISHASKSDPEFADEILGAVLAACARTMHELVMVLDWYFPLLAAMASCTRGWGDEISRQLVDVGLRVRDARPELVSVAKTLLIDPALLGNHLLFPVLSAAAWVSGEYAELVKDPVELVEAHLQPGTSLLPMSVRAVYIQAAHKVITSCCSIYLERSADSNKELDVVFKRLGIDQTVSGGSEAAIGSGEEQQIVGNDFFSEKSILHMIKLIEAKVGPLLLECNEVDVLERACNLIGFVHLIRSVQEVTQAKEIVKNMQKVFSQELSPVSVNAKNHPCNSETNIRVQPYISAGK